MSQKTFKDHKTSQSARGDPNLNTKQTIKIHAKKPKEFGIFSRKSILFKKLCPVLIIHPTIYSARKKYEIKACVLQ